MSQPGNHNTAHYEKALVSVSMREMHHHIETVNLPFDSLAEGLEKYHSSKTIKALRNKLIKGESCRVAIPVKGRWFLLKPLHGHCDYY
jgi:hypothetical protein